jgi:uncharacterized OsmC-like protein
MGFEVRTASIAGAPTAIGWADSFTLVIDRPVDAGGGGLGFNGAQLLYLAVAGCVSNDLFREGTRLGIRLDHVEVRVDGDFAGNPSVSTDVTYHVSLGGDASEEQLRALVAMVDGIAEIPNSLRNGTAVRLGAVHITGRPA